MFRTTSLTLLTSLATAACLEPSSDPGLRDHAAPLLGAELDPSSLGELTLWLDGTRGVTTSSQGEVLSWADQSGLGRHMFRGSPDVAGVTYQAYPASGSRNGSVCFMPGPDGANGYLVNTSVVERGPFTVAMALRPTGGEYAIPFTGTAAPALTIRKYTSPLLGAESVIRASAGGGDQFTFVQGGPWRNEPLLALVGFAGPSSWIEAGPATPEDGGGLTWPPQLEPVPAGPSTGPLSGSTLDGLVLSHGGAFAYQGCIGEVLIYRGDLDTTARAELAEYLRARYGGR